MAKVKDDYESFDADDYLAVRYKDVTDKHRGKFLLGCFHTAFQSLPNSLTVLEYGSGPVIQHCISAAAHASEIVFSDFAESNREAVRKWLRRDPTAFNWSPHFDYVVKTLEGKGEKEAREREEMVRKMVKDVVHCDVCAEPPIEKGFEGPYDVVIEGGCLIAACTTVENFKKGLAKLSRLLKSGGSFLMWSVDISMERSTTIHYIVGGKMYRSLCIDKETVIDAVKEAEFSVLDIQCCELENCIIEQTVIRSYYFIHAKKGGP